jgi:hypothetical protein
VSTSHVSKECGFFTFRVKHSSWNVLALKMMAPLIFEKVGTAHPTTQHYIPGDLQHQQNCCENLKCPENERLRDQIYVNIFLTLIIHFTVVKTIWP